MDETGGGLCIYLNDSWCTNTTVVEQLCCPDVEFLMLKCRPFYIPCEFSVVYICAVYIPPDANAKLALSQLYECIHKCLVAHPESTFIVAEDFDHANLKTVLHSFHRNVKCATRGNNILDQVYTNIAHGYRAQVYPHLGLFDHVSLLLHPCYTPTARSTRPVVRSVRTWPDDAIPRLQDCFDSTDWDVSVLDYINFCVDTVTSPKQVYVAPNQKPWMTAKLKSLINARGIVYRSGDTEAYSAARAALRRGISSAKLVYKNRIEAHFHNSSNSRQVWEGIRAITDYKGVSSPPVISSATLAEELNIFYATR